MPDNRDNAVTGAYNGPPGSSDPGFLSREWIDNFARQTMQNGEQNSRAGRANRQFPIDPNSFNLPGWQERAAQQEQERARLLSQGAGNPYTDTAGWQATQGALGDLLMRRAQGQDSLAALQLREAADRNIGQQQALVAGAGPGQQAMMARIAAQNQGRINQGLAGQTEQAQIAERYAASNALAGLSQGAVAARQNQQAITNEALANAWARQQAEAELRQRGLMNYEQQKTSRYGAIMGEPYKPESPGWLDRAVGAVSNGLAAYAIKKA